MTLQDYLNLVTNSLGNYFNFKTTVAIPVLVAFIILIIGVIVASVLKRVWLEVVKFLSLEKTLSGIDSYSSLTKSNKNLSLTELGGTLIWWSIVIVFVLPGLKALGINQVDRALSQLFSFVPTAIVGTIYLSLGSLVAWFAYNLVSGVGQLIKIPASSTIAKLIAAAVVVYSILLALTAFGVSSEFVRFGLFATLASTALAFGLAGKDLAADILKKVKDIIK